MIPISVLAGVIIYVGLSLLEWNILHWLRRPTTRLDAVVALRAERDGGAAGRTYSIVAEVLDGTGNDATASCVVVVPRNRKKK